MSEILFEIEQMLDDGRNSLDIAEELNVPDTWIQYAIEDRLISREASVDSIFI